jgi:hypothetical protein
MAGRYRFNVMPDHRLATCPGIVEKVVTVLVISTTLRVSAQMQGVTGGYRAREGESRSFDVSWGAIGGALATIM